MQQNGAWDANRSIQPSRMMHAQYYYMIPGPNPIVAPAPDGWSSSECEMAGGVFETGDNPAGKYSMPYHCLNKSHESYNVGISTANSPLGPWTQPAKQPILATTPGAWDHDSVASMNILKNPEPGHNKSQPICEERAAQGQY